jgi:putative DNA primase/helicase
VKISDLLSNFKNVAPEGDGWVMQCPAHDDSHASLKLAVTDEGKAIIKCRAGCNSNDVVSSTSLGWPAFFNLEVDEGAPVLAAGVRPEVSGGPVAILKGYLDAAASTAAQDYVAERFGLDVPTMEAAGLGYDPGGHAIPCDYTGKAWNAHPRLVVPFRGFDGVARGAQGRDLSGMDTSRWCSLTNPDGSEWSKLAVFTTGSGLDTYIITEGPGDALTALAAGYNSVAIRGAALKANARLIHQLVEGLKGKRVLVCGDNDRAGQSFANDLATSLAAEGIDAHVLAVPNDADDLSAAYEADPSDFRRALEKADGNAEPPGGILPPPPVSDDDDYELTDLGNAQRLVASFDGNLRYSEELGFLVYSGGVWQEDRFDSVRTAAQDLVQRMGRDAQELIALGEARRDAAIEERGKKLYGHSKASQSTRALDAMVKEAKAVAGVRVDIEHFDMHPHLLAFSNGVVDLRTSTLMPHDRDLLLTRRLSIPYTEDATCPRWERFLVEVFPGDPAMADYIRRLIGYGITGDTSEQAFAILWGTGANGKSVFTDTLSHVFAAISNTTPFSTFEKKQHGGGIPNDLAALKGARLVFASEGEQGVPMAEATLKRVTGQDLITARFMRREFFSFKPTFLILLATNFRPNFKGQDEGLWRRVKLVPWARYFKPEERDHKLVHQLKDEAEGIAAWAVRGAREWYTNGLGDPVAIVKATESYRSTSDALDGFFPGVLQTGTEKDVVACPEVFHAYVAWCDEEDLPHKERWSRRALYAAMEERGIPRVKRSDNTYFVGLKLAPKTSSATVVGGPPEGWHKQGEQLTEVFGPNTQEQTS